MADQHVKVTFGADTSQFETGLSRMKSDIIKFENDSKAFVKNIKDHWMGMTAAVAAAAVLANKAWDMVKVGAEFAEQQGVLDNLSAKYKTTANDIVDSMRKASDGMIANADLMQIALGGIAKGLKPEQLTRLSEAADLLADVSGGTATEALNKMAEALETGRMKGAKALAGSIDLKESFGELAGKLTEAEKAQAMYALIMIKSTDWQNQQTKAVDGTADELARLEASYKNLTLQAATYFKTVVVGAVNAAKAVKDGGLANLIPGMAPVTAAASIITGKYGKGGKAAGATTSLNMGLSDLNAEKMLADLKATVAAREDVAKAVEKQVKAVDKHTKAVKDNEKAEREAAKAIKEAHKVAAETIARNYENATNQMMDEINAGVEETMKSIDLIEQYNKMKLDNQIDGMDAADKAIKDIKDQETQKYALIAKLRDQDLINAKENEDKKAEIVKKYEADKVEIAKVASQKISKIHMEVLYSGLGDMASAFRGIASAYEEGSQSAKKWEEAAHAFEIAQRAVAVVQAVSAIATQGLGDPYTAFARIAAMAATMGALLATIGESVGGGSASAPKSTSTALGSDEASQSVSKSYELLKDTYSMQYERLTKLHDQLRSLNTNITGLVTSITRTGGITAGMNINTDYIKGDGRKAWDDFNDSIFGAFAGKWLGGLSNSLGSLGEKIFGGGTSKEITQTGLSIGSATLAEILAGGVDAQQYAKIKTTKSGGWFGSDKTSYSTAYQGLDADVYKMLDMVFQSLGSSLISLSDAFGLDTQKALEYSFSATKINLKGMTSEEMTTAVNEYISTISDNAAEAILGSVIGGYQQLNEGLLETATRLLRDKEVIAELLEKTNRAFSGTTEDIIACTESLIEFGGSLDDLTDSINTYYDAFFSDAEKHAQLTKDLGEAMAGLGGMPGSRSGFRAIVEALDLTTASGREAYATMMRLAGAADDYYSYMEEEAEAALEKAQEAAEAAKARVQSEYDARKAALTDAYNIELDAAQKRLSDISEIVNKLSAALDRMKIQDRQIEAQQFSAAKNALMRGSWDDKSLDLLTGINPGQYSSRVDYLRDYGEIYNQISTMSTDANARKSAAERTIDWLKNQYDLDVQSLELQRQQAESLIVIKQVCTRNQKGLQEFADGGIASGPSSGYEARLHGTELVISPRRGYSASVKGTNEDVVKAVNELRSEFRGILVSMNLTSMKAHDVIDNWDRIGIPATQT